MSTEHSPLTALLLTVDGGVADFSLAAGFLAFAEDFDATVFPELLGFDSGVSFSKSATSRMPQVSLDVFSRDLGSMTFTQMRSKLNELFLTDHVVFTPEAHRTALSIFDLYENSTLRANKDSSRDRTFMMQDAALILLEISLSAVLYTYIGSPELITAGTLIVGGSIGKAAKLSLSGLVVALTPPFAELSSSVSCAVLGALYTRPATQQEAATFQYLETVGLPTEAQGLYNTSLTELSLIRLTSGKVAQ